jgi:acyl carrier protein
MGLDTVELVLAVEKRFSIKIPNEVAARLAT